MTIKKNSGNEGKALLSLTLACFFILTFHANVAYAQSVVLTQPTSGTITTPFGWVPSQGRHHQGLDIAASEGTALTPRGSVTCMPFSSTAGNWAVIENGCCVQERWLHLLKCSLPDIQTGNTGSSSGPHLHWDVAIKGVKVDPALAAGQNLCDKTVQDTLIADGRARFPKNGGGGGAGGEACTAPPPAQEPVTGYEYVPPVTNPITGEVITPPYVVVTPPVGVPYIQLVPGPGQPVIDLPPAVTTGFTQSTPTTNEVTGCATDTWNAMTNQAVLETRREMVVNQTIVAKPDSILAYSCFEKALDHAGEYIGPIFNENKTWANKDIDVLGDTFTVHVDMGERSLDGAIYNAANYLAETFLNEFFAYEWVGETTGAAIPAGPPPIGGSDAHTHSPQSGASCATMANVWQMAKCTNTLDTPGFPTFSDLIGNDPRQYPKMYTCSDTGIDANMIEIAKGRDVAFAPINSYMSILKPPSGCAPPVFTGVTVQRSSGSGIVANLLSYQDGVCITPGCHYERSGFSAGTCEASGP